MKGRSQRLPPPAAHMDDWVDGSWTVDCPCGVTYDDGDEMVKCDECGVWVHTRCTRFVKEEASFTCDKCKGSRVDLGDDAAPGAAAPAIANIEETEVAQLLAELPTKADPCPPPTYQRTGFRRWAELPMEEKVHVQGVPGGDPALFAGVSAVFSGELWKCTGYVPKKFNFKYREFPCWDHDENDNPASTGADLLVSLSAGVVSEAVERLESSAVTRSSDGNGLFSGGGHSFTKKERSKFRGLGFHSGKRREMNSAGSKDRSVKKIRISASSEKNRGTKHAGSAPRVDGSKLGLIDKGVARRLNVELEKMRDEDKRAEKSSGLTNDIRLEGESIKDDSKNASVKISSGVAVIAASEHKSLPEAHVKEEKVEVQGTVCNGNLSKMEDHAKSAGPTSLIVEVPAKEDADDNKPNRSNDEGSDFRSLEHASIRFDAVPGQLKHTIGDFASGSQVFLEPNNKFSKRPFESKHKEETISDVDQADEMRKKPTPFVSSGLEAQSLLTEHVKGPCVSLPNNPHSHEMLTRQEKDACILQVDKKELANQPVREQSARIISGPSESKELGPELETMVVQSTGIVSGPSESITLGPEQEPMGEQGAGVVSKPSESKKLGPEQEPVGGQDKTVEAHHSQSSTREHAKLGSASAGYVAREQNLVVVVGKLSSMSNVQGTPKLPNSDSYRSPDTISSSTATRTVPFTKRAKVSSSTVSKKETVGNGLSAEGNLHGETSLQSKGSAISEDNSLVKKNTRASSLKYKSVESKENGPCPSKTSSAENSTSSSGSGRLGGPPQNQCTSLLAKLAHSDSVTKNIRKTSPNYQASSRLVNHPTTMHPLIPPSVVNTSTTLSDEELAKRLHHELNSSPRVSRVPRGLHASGIQFASTTSASMLSKRSSSSNSGGKHQVLHDSKVSRRRNKEDTGKDTGKDATHSCEGSDKAEKLEHMPFTTHGKLSESFHVSDSIKKDVHTAQNVLHSVKETSQLIPIAVDGSGPLFRTLPGLIDEIMNEGRHMTYEELCDAILPHWSSLRKPNGEQYVYSSHSLAVLDCLRNKDEWAHLVDCEPKTCPSKKRSKSNVPRSTEGSTNGKAKGASMERKDRNEDWRREHRPTKGKRLARKRRKLMLRGRAVQVSRGREIGDVSDDDFRSLSGEEGSRSLSSKDEIQGSGRHNSASRMSDSSPEESD